MCVCNAESRKFVLLNVAISENEQGARFAPMRVVYNEDIGKAYRTLGYIPTVTLWDYVGQLNPIPRWEQSSISWSAPNATNNHVSRTT
jgi:hypothetical protein